MLNISIARAAAGAVGALYGSLPRVSAIAVLRRPVSGAGALGSLRCDAFPIERLESRQLLSAGQLDPLFGNDGVAQLNGVSGLFEAVKSLPSGKILAAGTAKGSDGKFSLLLARFNPDGKLDSTFGSGGDVITRAGGFTGGARLAVLANGKFYVAGNALARFNINGTLDSTFGSGGIVQFNDGIASAQAGLALQADGKIVALHGLIPDPNRDQGTRGPIEGANYKVEISRYTTSGKLDTTFNKTGRVRSFAAGDQFGAPGGYIIPQDVAVYNGKIIVGVSLRSSDLHDSTPAFGAERLNSDGSIDHSFGTNGVGAFFYDEPYGDSVQRIAISPNGTINIVGEEGDTDWDYVTLSAEGKTSTWQRISTYEGEGADLVVQSNGKVIMTGADYLFNPNPQGRFRLSAGYVVRMNPNGTMDNLRFDTASVDLGDPSFNGAVTFFSQDYFPGGVTLDSANNMIAAGHLGGTDPAGTPILYRLLGGSSRAGAVLGTDHILRVGGTDSGDTINVSRNGSSINVTINGSNFGTFAASSVQGVHAFGNAGNDSITVLAGSIPALLVGAAGNDSLTGGGGPNTLHGGDGNDFLFPGTGPSNDIFGDAGNDFVSYAKRTHGVEIHLDGLRDSGMSGEHDLISTDVENAYGSQGNDIIFGNFTNVKGALYGLGGNDSLYAGNAPNALYGGDGNDVLYSRDNIHDYLDGGNGTDSAHIDLLDQTVSVEIFLV